MTKTVILGQPRIGSFTLFHTGARLQDSFAAWLLLKAQFAHDVPRRGLPKKGCRHLSSAFHKARYLYVKHSSCSGSKCKMCDLRCTYQDSDLGTRGRNLLTFIGGSSLHEDSGESASPEELSEDESSRTTSSAWCSGPSNKRDPESMNSVF